MKRLPAFLALAAFLAGCSSGPDMASPDQIAKFVPGKTDETEVVAVLGKPLQVIQQADGTRIAQYPYDSGKSSGGSIVPGFLGGGSSSSSYGMVSLRYDSRGTLKEIIGK